VLRRLAGQLVKIAFSTDHLSCSFDVFFETTRGIPPEIATVGGRMMTIEPMTTRGAHYTALLHVIDHQGVTKLHAKEREQLLQAADALLFGEPESERLVRAAEAVIESLETSERWSAEGCDQLREHLYGCDAPAAAS
jgi:hypothetical protein